MHQLTNEIIASKEWRTRELENMKKIGLISLVNASDKVKNQYYRMCVPYIYAHWEGFVVESIKQIVTFLNNQHLNKENVCNELYSFSVLDEIRPLAGKQSFDQICNFVKKFTLSFRKELYIDLTLVTAKSNLNFKQLNVMMQKMGMSNDLYSYEREINQLVNQRNRIAHGENSIIITYEYVDKKIYMLQEVFDILILEYEKYLSEKKYLK
jgi:hypothetical protein